MPWSSRSRRTRSSSDKPSFVLPHGAPQIGSRTLALERRGDELDGIVAGPFRGAGHRAELAARGIDQQRGRHAGGATHDLQVLENPGAGVGVIGGPTDADLLEPGARLVGIARVDVDRDYLEARAAELVLQRLKRR